MSALGWVGRALRITIDGTVIAAVRAKRVSYAAEAIDISDGERDGYRRLLDVPDGRSVTVSVEGVATSANWLLLRDQWEGNSFTDVQILHPDGSVQAARDGAVLSALSRTAEHKGFVAFSAQFALSGLVSMIIGPGDGDESGGPSPPGGAGDNGVRYFTSKVYPEVPPDTGDAIELLLDAIEFDAFRYVDGGWSLGPGFIWDSADSLIFQSDAGSPGDEWSAVINGVLYDQFINGSNIVTLQLFPTDYDKTGIMVEVIEVSFNETGWTAGGNTSKSPETPTLLLESGISVAVSTAFQPSAPGGPAESAGEFIVRFTRGAYTVDLPVTIRAVWPNPAD